MSTLKKEARDIADRLPDEASFDDFVYQVYVRQRIAEGNRAADEGRVQDHDDVKQRFAER
jgi:predicted transcriptional regulator